MPLLHDWDAVLSEDEAEEYADNILNGDWDETFDSLDDLEMEMIEENL